MTTPEIATEFVLGLPLTRVRDLLRAWRYGPSRSIWALAERSRIDPRLIALVLDHADRVGLTAEETDPAGDTRLGLSRAGYALAHASARPPTKRDRASARLEMLVARCQQINARADLPFRVAELWIYGSLLDPNRKAVGDINIALRWADAPGLSTEAALDRYYTLARALAVAPPGDREPADAIPPIVRRYTLYDGGRPGLIQERPLGELVDLACPCRCLFDASRGGVVHDPVLPHHPRSLGRDPRFRDPGDVPRVPEAGTGKPIRASLLNEREASQFRYERYGPWPAGDPRYQRLRHQPNFESLFLDRAAGKDALVTNAVARRLSLRRCDGQARTAFVCGQFDLRRGYPERRYPPIRASASCLVERRVVRRPDRIQYRLRVLRTDRLGPLGRDSADPYLMAWWLHTLAVADLEGLRRAAQAAGERRPVQLHWRVVGDSPLDQRLKTVLEGTPHLGCLKIPNPKTEDSDAPVQPVPA